LVIPTFFSVVIKVPVVVALVLKPIMVNSFPPAPMIILSGLNDSISPFAVTKIYLSSSYGKKNSLLSEVIVFV
jgi:hypothetical protein